MVSQDKDTIALLNTLQEKYDCLEVEVRAIRNNIKNKNKMLADLLLKVPQIEKKVDTNKQTISIILNKMMEHYKKYFREVEGVDLEEYNPEDCCFKCNK